MHPSQIALDPELLKRLYEDERLTTEAIAAKLGCAPITIQRRLRQFQITSRPRGPLPLSRTLHGDLRWSPNVAWAVGVIATDGNLSGDGRHLSVVSKDRDMLETLCTCLSL